MSVVSRGAAAIDWSQGGVVGFAVADDPSVVAAVELWLDGVRVASGVAATSVFEMADALRGLPVPAREHSGFVLRIPQGALLPRHLETAGVLLELRVVGGAVLLAQRLERPQDLLLLTEGAPVDLLYEVRFLPLRAGTVRGVVSDRHGLGRPPRLLIRLNDGPAQPLPLHEATADGRSHLFEWPLPATQLAAGENQVRVTGLDSQPLAQYPLQAGPSEAGLAEQRLSVLEAEVAFLKQVLMSRQAEPTAARLAVLKNEIIAVCADMLGLQRVHLEREIQARLDAGAPAPRGRLRF